VPVYNRTCVGDCDRYTFAPGPVRHVKGVAYVLVALLTVDALELTWYFSAKGVGRGVWHPRPMLYSEVKLAHKVDPPGLLPDEVLGSH